MGGPNAGPNIFPSGMLDGLPKAKAQNPPYYPPSLRQAGVEGRAVIQFTVDPTGQVVAARIVEATQAEFGEAARRAVLRWRFEPGRRQGRAVPFLMSISVEFTLAGS